MSYGRMQFVRIASTMGGGGSTEAPVLSDLATWLSGLALPLLCLLAASDSRGDVSRFAVDGPTWVLALLVWERSEATLFSLDEGSVNDVEVDVLRLFDLSEVLRKLSIAFLRTMVMFFLLRSSSGVPPVMKQSSVLTGSSFLMGGLCTFLRRPWAAG